ncbi:hypothetical protein [Croceicoccus naphthovorans]|uniref:Uncharacterized protein n=1 Tax=Croceicoccus naphthovorans TaxID=1348774 RepID=A0A0G3XFY7_9SPHN|nr:hypothetical protein [Croceicoccus naphthovorans]AKM10470.1 hypothetical protein AB433_11655 [Croceicoccus naphthovorans]MBB3988643.1 hypothetical protein [Croceicoccus naphthovorans]
MWAYYEKWATRPRWLKRLTFFVAIPAWIGGAVLFVSGSLFSHQTLGLLLFAAFAFVAVMGVINSLGVNRSDQFSWFSAAIALCIVGIPIGFLALHKPTPAPQNATVYGCYVGDLAPPILLDEGGMHILQPEFPTIPFHLERHKTGIVLTADAPIQARAADGRYVYSFYEPGIGTFLNFFQEVNGRRYGVYDVDDLSGFSMLPRTLVSGEAPFIEYAKASSETCLSISG